MSEPIPSGFNVYWEPWVDVYDTMMSLPTEELGGVEGVDDTDGYIEHPPMENFEQGIKAIFTPFGIMPLTEDSLASSHFKFWVGHTNFKLSKRGNDEVNNIYLDTIESTSGVEAINFLTPYRFRVAIGKVFSDREVMYEIKENLIRAASHIDNY